MNKIFYIEWKGRYTNKTYRLEVYPPGNTFTNPEFVKLDKHIVDLKDFEWRFNDICMGINSNANLEVKWFLNYINNDEFIDILFNSPVTYQLPTAIDWVDYQAGNIYRLKIDNVIVYRGVQLTDDSYGFDGSDTYKVELTSFSKHLTTCFNFKDYITMESHLLSLSNSTSPIIYEYFDKYQFNRWRCIANVAANKDADNQNAFRFWDIQSFENWLKTALQTCANKIARETTVINFALPLATYYKQDYAGNQGLGAALSKSDIKILSYVTIKNEVVGGLFAHTEDSMSGKYATIFDLLSDWADSEGQKLFLSPAGTNIMPYPMFAANPNFIFIDPSLVTIKEVKSFNRKQVTVSLEEFSNEDIDNYRYTNGVPRNKEELQMPLLWNNTPPVNNYDTKNIIKDYIISAGFEHSTIGELYISSNPVRLWNFYYLDQPSGLIESRAFRVHDFCKSDTRIRAGVATESIATEPNIMSVDYDTVNHPDRYCLAVQSLHAKASMFNRLTVYFGMPKVSKLEMSIPFKDFQFNDIYAGANNVIVLDMANFHARLSDYPVHYHLISVNYDIEKESFNIEAIGVKI